MSAKKDELLANEEGGSSDGASIEIIAYELKKCTQYWNPKTRLIGNVRAEDIARLCDSVLRDEKITKIVTNVV